MMFTKRLREGVRRGDITCSVRIWTRPHVKVCGRYPMEEGAIEVDSIEPIGLPDITPQMARASGFLGVLDLVTIAQHGRGQNIYLVRFHYVAPQGGSGHEQGAREKPARSREKTIQNSVSGEIKAR
ncbi:MAG TPA: ASCH domain-containing protein [Acidobacteriaceae bacterium]|jgi:hypothetical protein|nr:ASCH domain-containing protein [Acidobacteriaceae bacterium]